jgi:hypothetical protein
MQLLFFVLTFMATATAARRCGISYQQCGGKTFTGSTCCSTVSECVYVSDFYSQCMPLSFASSKCAKVYQQCEGKGFNGETCCTPDSACLFDNEYYSQCLPVPEVDPPSPTTSPTHAATAAPTSAPVLPVNK